MSAAEIGGSRDAWWESAVFYHVYPLSFQDSNGDGYGDLPGLRDRLPYLKWLGIDAVWLSPIYCSPMNDWGYDISDHWSIDPKFGTMEDFDDVMRVANELGIRVVLDLVVNHTSVEHPWFKDAQSGRNAKHRDWYNWLDAKEDGSEPNNWIGVFGIPAWTYDEASGQYYMCKFLPSMIDLNWRNPAVQSAVSELIQFWVDKGVSGFRVDAADHLMKDPDFRDNPPNEKAISSAHLSRSAAYNSQLHVNDRGHPDTIGIFKQWREMLDNAPDHRRVLLAEVITRLDHARMPHWASYYGDNLDAAHMPLNLSMTHLSWSAQAFREAIEAVEAHIPDGGWPSLVLSSHDEARLASRYGYQQSRLLLTLLLTLRGTPIIYMGDELSLENSPVEPGQERDVLGQMDSTKNRDRGRTPMPWTSGEHLGFSTGEPWLPLPESADDMSVEKQAANPGSTLLLVHDLLAIRRQSQALREGIYQTIEAGEDVVAFRRMHDNEQAIVAVNFSEVTQYLDIIEGESPVLLEVGSAFVAGGVLELGPLSAVVLRDF